MTSPIAQRNNDAADKVRRDIEDEVHNALQHEFIDAGLFVNRDTIRRVKERVEKLSRWHPALCGPGRKRRIWVRQDENDRTGLHILAFGSMYVHDCDNCVFLGQADAELAPGEWTVVDLYACGGGVTGATLIARHGNDGHEYASYPVMLLERGLCLPGEHFGQALEFYRWLEEEMDEGWPRSWMKPQDGGP